MANMSSTEPIMGRFVIRGVSKQSGQDIEMVMDAATAANAKVKAEMQGTVVTEVIDILSRQPPALQHPEYESGKPWKVTTIGGMRIGSGICNILAGLIFSWLLVPVLLIPLGITEIISGSNLLKQNPKRPSNPIAIAILEIAGILTLAGWIPLVVGILSIIWLGDEQVKIYLGTLGVSVVTRPQQPYQAASR